MYIRSKNRILRNVPLISILVAHVHNAVYRVFLMARHACCF